jgi:hypothetical protein
MTLTKFTSNIGQRTRFGPEWLGKRCLAKTRSGTLCQRPAYKHNGRCRLHGGASTGARTPEGVQRISEANIKHGRQTKDKLAAQRHSAKVGRRVIGELKRIEQQIVDAGLMSDD